MEDFQYLHETFGSGHKSDQKISLSQTTPVVFIPGNDPRIIQLNDSLNLLSPTEEFLFIRADGGEDLAALVEKIHAYSPVRAARPLLLLDCSSITSEEGWDAQLQRIANSRAATVGLLNVERMPTATLALMGKLEDRCRYILSSARSLEDAGVGAAGFSKVPHILSIPPIRERAEDIPQLLQAAWGKRFQDARISLSAMLSLKAYAWPGNYMEMLQFAQQMGKECHGGAINPEDLPDKFILKGPTLESMVDLPLEGIDLRETIFKIEDSLILQALDRTQGNKNKASKLLKLNRTTLIEKMKKRGLEAKQK